MFCVDVDSSAVDNSETKVSINGHHEEVQIVIVNGDGDDGEKAER